MSELKILHQNTHNTNNSYYSCIECGWNGDVKECELDTEYDEFKGVDRTYPICPKCGGGVE